MWKAHSLQMEWCLDCHRAPEKNIRPRDQVFNIGPWTPAREWTGSRRAGAGEEVSRAERDDRRRPAREDAEADHQLLQVSLLGRGR